MDFDATFIFSVLSFIVFVIIMNAIFYAPVLKIMKERQNYVEKNFKSAKESEIRAGEQTEYRNSELEKSRAKVREEIAEKTKVLKNERTKELTEYKNKLFGEISAEKENLRRSAYDAKDRLKESVDDIASQIYSMLSKNSENTNESGRGE